MFHPSAGLKVSLLCHLLFFFLASVLILPALFVFQLLWSFCSTQFEEAETRPFRLTHAIPGASKVLDYDSELTFAESGLANSMISVTWEWSNCAVSRVSGDTPLKSCVEVICFQLLESYFLVFAVFLLFVAVKWNFSKQKGVWNQWLDKIIFISLYICRFGTWNLNHQLSSVVKDLLPSLWTTALFIYFSLIPCLNRGLNWRD